METVGLYVIGDDGTPLRVGFALGNEYSDHVTERQNYLYLAHSKLRQSSFGPELLLGEMPRSVRGHARLLRDGQAVWESDWLSGEDNMCHAIANLEHHHFKYPEFRSPGDVHVHYFGAATGSFTQKFETRRRRRVRDLRGRLRPAAAQYARRRARTQSTRQRTSSLRRFKP